MCRDLRLLAQRVFFRGKRWLKERDFWEFRLLVLSQCLLEFNRTKKSLLRPKSLPALKTIFLSKFARPNFVSSFKVWILVQFAQAIKIFEIFHCRLFVFISVFNHLKQRLNFFERFSTSQAHNFVTFAKKRLKKGPAYEISCNFKNVKLSFLKQDSRVDKIFTLSEMRSLSNFWVP